MADVPQNSETIRKRKPGKGKPFVKGQSGNPGGRPKAIFKFGEYLRQFFNSNHPQAAEINSKLGYKAVKTQLDVIVQRLAKDDPKVLLAYGFGKPVESLEISGKDGQPLKLYSVVSPDDL